MYNIKFFIYLLAYVISFYLLCPEFWDWPIFRWQGSPSQHGKVKDIISRAEVIGARDNKSEN